MARDIKLTQDRITKKWDINFSNGDFETTNGLDSALYLSILGEARATEDQIPNPVLRRGHFTNIFSPVQGYELGSLLWLYTQERIQDSTESLVRTAVENGVKWLLDDLIVSNATVEVSKAQYGYNISVNLTNQSQERGNYFELFVETFK